MTLEIALAQLRPAGSPAENLELGLDACREAAANGADIVLLPEMWQIGYDPCPTDDPGRAAWLAGAIGTDDAWVQAFRSIAAELGVAVVATYLQSWDGRPRNAATLFDRHGREVFTYAKVHTCRFWFEAELTPGWELPVATLDTAAGPVRVGMMICYDREFPETARLLMLGGAELVLVPNACHLDVDRVGQFRSRAFENMTAMAMTNYPEPWYNGHSCAFDSMVGRERDQCMVETDGTPQIAYASLDLEALRVYRDQHIWGDAYRRPEMYVRLSDPTGAGTLHGSARPDRR